MMRNLLHKRNVWALAILMVIAALGIAQAATTRPQTASLSGQVVTAVSVGASVQEGSEKRRESRRKVHDEKTLRQPQGKNLILFRFYNLFWGAKVTVQMRVLSAPTFFSIKK